MVPSGSQFLFFSKMSQLHFSLWLRKHPLMRTSYISLILSLVDGHQGQSHHSAAVSGAGDSPLLFCNPTPHSFTPGYLETHRADGTLPDSLGSATFLLPIGLGLFRNPDESSGRQLESRRSGVHIGCGSLSWETGKKEGWCEISPPQWAMTTHPSQGQPDVGSLSCCLISCSSLVLQEQTFNLNEVARSVQSRCWGKWLSRGRLLACRHWPLLALSLRS